MGCKLPYYHAMLEAARLDPKVGDVEFAAMALKLADKLRSEVPIPKDLQVENREATNDREA